jgi:hypothetical protein
MAAMTTEKDSVEDSSKLTANTGDTVTPKTE